MNQVDLNENQGHFLCGKRIKDLIHQPPEETKNEKNDTMEKLARFTGACYSCLKEISVH